MRGNRSAVTRWVDGLDVSMRITSLAVRIHRDPPSPGIGEELRQVADTVSLDGLTRTELQLLPILAGSFQRWLPDHAATRIAQGAKRRAAAEGLMAESAARAALDALSEGGISAAALKGLALSPRYATLGWRRPMGDADLLLTRDAPWSELEGLLKAHGFAPGPGTLHAHNFDLPDGRRVDVHRWLSIDTAFPAAIAGTRACLIRRPDGALSGWELPVEIHMAHTIEHAMRWNPIPPARSVADVAALALTSPELSWVDVWSVLESWGKADNARVFVERLAAAEVVPKTALREPTRETRTLDRWCQALDTLDPRESFASGAGRHLVVMPLRLRQRGSHLTYREYLRNLWEVDPRESLTRVAWGKALRKIRYGRDLPEFAEV